ncbi:MAG TPA: hypothetical protein P5255_14990 [Phycisphaerae bacterium]|nr:hypothetical protein [Phycisphaerae bacterium]
MPECVGMDAFRETGPAAMADFNTPTACDVRERSQPAPPEVRDEWPPLTRSAESGIVTHWPTWFEDPFVDKGAGRTDCTNPRNVYRMGWEDFVATPYSLGRHIVNWMFLPASAVVTPPCTVMASDGKLSRQCLGCDHDATRLCRQFAEQPPIHGEFVPMETLEGPPEWKDYCPPPPDPAPCEPQSLGV